jgi:hypothetical protein
MGIYESVNLFRKTYKFCEKREVQISELTGFSTAYVAEPYSVKYPKDKIMY